MSASVSGSGAGRPKSSGALICGRSVPAPSPTMANWLDDCSRTRTSTTASTVPFGSRYWTVMRRWNASGLTYSMTTLRAPAGISTNR